MISQLPPKDTYNHSSSHRNFTAKNQDVGAPNTPRMIRVRNMRSELFPSFQVNLNLSQSGLHPDEFLRPLWSPACISYMLSLFWIHLK